MDQGIDGGALPGVLQAHDDESFAQQHFVQKGQQGVLHVAAMLVIRWRPRCQRRSRNTLDR